MLSFNELPLLGKSIDRTASVPPQQTTARAFYLVGNVWLVQVVRCLDTTGKKQQSNYPLVVQAYNLLTLQTIRAYLFVMKHILLLLAESALCLIGTIKL